MQLILDLFFPVHCLGCHRENQSNKKHKEFICVDCFKRIPLNKKSPKLNQPSHLTDLLIVSDYEHLLLKQVIHRYKYDFIKELSIPLGRLMTQKLKNRNDIISNAVLVPVPLFRKRLRWRGFNQSELLASEISQKLNIPLRTDLIKRIKNTPPQAQIKNSLQRKANIKGIFQICHKTENNIKNRILILVDDVCTTGATLEECAKVIESLKPKSVIGLVLARNK